MMSSTMESEEGIVTVRRAEIDTRAPFQSVKEAVALFGERVLAGEVYANKLKEMRGAPGGTSHGPSKLGTVTAELKETKENLKKAKEEGEQLANCLTSLKEELEQTRRELQRLKSKESEKQPITFDSEIEDLKFVENTTQIEVQVPTVEDEGTEFQRRRYVKFADTPSFAQILNTEGGGQVLERYPSLKKKKKKPLIPLIAGIFSKKKGFQEASSPRAQA
ncbi:WEB family protein At1g75720-like [Magnolia sinica]|uniref:WEB family protein At1g75720-like n=1 Tax=Magnolia sinica TaxID=86752 RepID=UPI002658BE55|nr:WEB family protein At1g75720-like [Magnolia sinica]